MELPVIRKKAIYSDQPLDIWKNPLIMALESNRIKNWEELSDRLISIQKITEAEKILPDSQRKALLNFRMDSFFLPMSWHFELYEIIDSLLRVTYSNWGPSIEEGLYQDNRFVMRNENLRVNDSPAPSLVISGASGIGKSTSIERILSIYGHMIDHTDQDWVKGAFLQIPFLIVKCPNSGSTKDLCKEIIKQINRHTGMNLSTGRTETDLKIAIENQINTLKIGCIFLDEAQILDKLSNKKQEQFEDFMVNLYNLVHTPIILIKTNDGVEPDRPGNKEVYFLRRESSEGILKIPRFAKNDEDWNLMIETLFNYLQITKTQTVLTQDLKDLIYDLTQGYTFFLKELFIKAQKLAISDKQDNEELIGLERFSQAAKEDFCVISEKLKEIGDLKVLEKIQKTIEETTEVIKDTVSTKKKRAIRGLREYAKLIDLGKLLRREEIEEHINRFLENKNNLSLTKKAMYDAFYDYVNQCMEDEAYIDQKILDLDPIDIENIILEEC